MKWGLVWRGSTCAHACSRHEQGHGSTHCMAVYMDLRRHRVWVGASIFGLVVVLLAGTAWCSANRHALADNAAAAPLIDLEAAAAETGDRLPVPPTPTSAGRLASATCDQTLQSLIDLAPSGSVLTAPACVYCEMITIDKPLTLDGQGQAQI